MAISARDHGDDGMLVLAVQQGDADAFDTLFRRHYPAVHRACTRRLFDPVEADEMAQAAFVRAFERIDQCAGERRFGPWVHVIARSLCMDAFRARARVEPCGDPPSGRRDQRHNEPEESVLTSERAALVHEALADLPERQRSVVIARDWEELRPGEIADRLGVSIGAVDSLLLRARRRLALSYRRLAGEGGGGASTRTLRGAVATATAMLLAGQHAVATASVAAADAVGDTASRAASGVVGAVVTAAIGLGATAAPAVPPATPVPAVVTTVVAEVGRPPAGASLPLSVAPAPPAAPSSATLPAAGPPATGVPLPIPQVGIGSPASTAAMPAAAMPAAAMPATTMPATTVPATTTTTAPPPPPPSPAAAAAASSPTSPAPAAAAAAVDPKELGLPALPPITVPTIPPLGIGPGQR